MAMNRLGYLLFALILSGGVLFPAVARAQTPAQPEQPSDSDQQAKQKQDSDNNNNKKKTKENLRKLDKELATPYKKWLDEDVAYVITSDERNAFLRLQTND